MLTALERINKRVEQIRAKHSREKVIATESVFGYMAEFETPAERSNACVASTG
jgi:hypothetical protein